MIVIRIRGATDMHLFKNSKGSLIVLNILTLILLFLITTVTFAENRLLSKYSENNTNIVVFVHGFTGNYKDTWGDFPLILKNDDDLKHYDIMSWGYPTNIFGKNPNIEKIGNYLGSELSTLSDRYNNIFLVGHSMGGLVIRSFIISNLEKGQSSALENINGIVLFGTPNEGMANASMIPKFVNRQIFDMKQTGEFIINLRNKWIQRVYNPDKIDDYHAKIPTTIISGINDYFVPQSSTESFFKGTEVTDGDHVSMVKPSNQEHLSYRLLKKFLLKSSENSFIYDKSKLEDVLVEVQSSLRRKLLFIEEDVDRYLKSPTKTNWEIVQQEARENLNLLNSSIELAINFDSRNKIRFARYVSAGNRHILQPFAKIERFWDGRRYTLRQIGLTQQPNSEQVSIWRNELVHIYQGIERELENLIKAQ